MFAFKHCKSGSVGTWHAEKIFKKQAFKIGELGKKGEIRTTVSLKQI